MSIYVVKLSEWYPPGDESYGILMASVSCSRCYGCGSRLRYSKVVGHHSIPWGNGDIWCSWKCHNSGKKAKMDRRRLRTSKRRYPENWTVDMCEIPEEVQWTRPGFFYSKSDRED
jgi:hypothetical protein